MKRLVLASVLAAMASFSALAQSRTWEQIRPVMQKDLCFTVPSTGQPNLYACHGQNGTQLFQIVPHLDRQVSFHRGSECLKPAIGGQGPAFGSCNHYNNAHLWKMGEDGTIRDVSGKCLDIFGGRAISTTSVGLYACHGGNNQKWMRTNAGGESQTAPSRLPFAEKAVGVEITSQYGSKCIDNPPGTNKLILYECHRGQNQRFYILPDRTATGLMMGPRCVTAPAEIGQPLTLEPCNALPTQGWAMPPRNQGVIFRRHGDQTFNKQCLAYTPQNSPGGMTIVLGDCKAGVEYKWNIVGQ